VRPKRAEVMELPRRIQASPQAAGYAGMQQSLERGLTVLQTLAGHTKEHP
jgi:hypothetical protein